MLLCSRSMARVGAVLHSLSDLLGLRLPLPLQSRPAQISEGMQNSTDHLRSIPEHGNSCLWAHSVRPEGKIGDVLDFPNFFRKSGKSRTSPKCVEMSRPPASADAPGLRARARVRARKQPLAIGPTPNTSSAWSVFRPRPPPRPRPRNRERGCRVASTGSGQTGFPSTHLCAGRRRETNDRGRGRGGGRGRLNVQLGATCH